MKVGCCLVIKVFNVSKFVFGVGVSVDAGLVIELFDVVLFMILVDVVCEVGEVFVVFDCIWVLEIVEWFFWIFCDDYFELVKECVYGEGSGVVFVRVIFVMVLLV